MLGLRSSLSRASSPQSHGQWRVASILFSCPFFVLRSYVAYFNCENHKGMFGRTHLGVFIEAEPFFFSFSFFIN